MDRHTLGNGRITATVKADGAELCSLRDPQGREVLWQAEPAWPRHAPILFPIVGRLKGDELRHQGKTYPMTQHGFARDQRFKWSERESQSCALELQDNSATRPHYPFAFRLGVTYTLQDDTLIVAHDIENRGDVVLPASIGAHPAFQWPLPGAADKTSHTIVFSDAETAPVRRLENGLMRIQPEPTPVEGATLALSESVFVDDALIFDQIASTSLRYMAPGGPTIDFAWRGFRQLGLWSKPDGASFLCIEPWHGFASPTDFDGEFADKPGVMLIGVGETRQFEQRIGFS